MESDDLEKAVNEFHEALDRLKRVTEVYYTARFNSKEKIIEIYEKGEEPKRVIKAEEDSQIEAYRAITREIGRFLNIRAYKGE